MNKEVIISNIINSCSSRVDSRRFYKGKPFAHVVWNLYNPDNKIEYNDGYIIHHINKNTLDDRIENLQKVTRKEHGIIHGKDKDNSGKNNPMYGKKRSNKTKKQISKTLSDYFCDNKNSRYGIKMGQEQKNEISKSRKGKCLGKNNPNFGKKWSDERKKKESERVKEWHRNRKALLNGI